MLRIILLVESRSAGTLIHPTDLRLHLTLDESYCDWILPHARHFNCECLFFPIAQIISAQCVLLGGDIGRATRNAMGNLQAEYGTTDAHSSAEIQFEDDPIEAQSTVDCLCPGLDTYLGMWKKWNWG